MNLVLAIPKFFGDWLNFAIVLGGLILGGIAWHDRSTTELVAWEEIARDPVVQNGHITCHGFRRYYLLNRGPATISDVTLVIDEAGKDAQNNPTIQIVVQRSMNCAAQPVEPNGDGRRHIFLPTSNRLIAGGYLYVDIECRSTSWHELKVSPSSPDFPGLKLAPERPQFARKESQRFLIAVAIVLLVILLGNIERLRRRSAREERMRKESMSEGVTRSEKAKMDAEEGLVKDGISESDPFEAVMKSNVRDDEPEPREGKKKKKKKK